MTELENILRLAGIDLNESTSGMSEASLIKISEEGIEDAKRMQERFQRKGDTNSAEFCNRMIYRLYHLTQALKQKTGE